MPFFRLVCWIFRKLPRLIFRLSLLIYTISKQCKEKTENHESVLSTIVNKVFEQLGMRGVIINSHISEVFRKKIFCLQKALKKACNRGGRQLNALLRKLETGPRYRLNIISISISYSFVSFFRGFTFLTGVYVEYSLQNRFVFFISLFGLSAILKIRNGEQAHHMGSVVAYTWIREKQMFVALGKEFDMRLLL